MTQKSSLRQLNSQKTNSINEYVNSLHDQIDELYEALMDDETEVSMQIQRKLMSILRSLKINE